jgi:hypothetical protein
LVELSKIGLGRAVLGTKSKMAEFMGDLERAPPRTDWDLFAQLTADYACTMCGNRRGTVIFDKREPPSKEDLQDRYETLLRRAGFGCDRELAIYLCVKMRFKDKHIYPHGSIELIEKRSPRSFWTVGLISLKNGVEVSSRSAL